ncbi:hypothetical protein ACSLOS_31890, partial [Klebsiella pneumoniae]
SRTTLHRLIKAGDLSTCSGERNAKMVDTSELLRVFGPFEQLKHDGVRIFSRISTMAPGIQLILPGDFQEGAWPVSGCQCANP